MPLYEYQCESCANRFERIQKFSDPPVDTCPSCGGVVRKLLSSPAIQFKGSGWYITDYAKKGSDASGAKQDTSAKSTADSGPTGDSSPSSASTSTTDSSAKKSD